MDVDVDADLGKRGCQESFDRLQICMADSDRDWSKCQDLVKEWKACFNKENNDKGIQPKIL
eukprot:CAMPEP_0203775400 /NCGR_PEP_ID=MMETSP0099_2-20121227/6061_1 /ASSEMBLY_ACC=CAM_ASM_000209 /TAXON_ID=96639 /ORGANISM=" , Strain NY0313808BC1" /LENGTH=60 /DNA_ID=CAMNT_0050674075 /DNA_START=90 /DNA_END=272 /DNA_ORIENTATION=-